MFGQKPDDFAVTIAHDDSEGIFTDPHAFIEFINLGDLTDEDFEGFIEMPESKEPQLVPSHDEILDSLADYGFDSDYRDMSAGGKASKTPDIDKR